MVSKSVLVTGGFGFIGRYVAQALAREGHVVKAIGHGAWGRNEWRGWGISEWHLADVSIESLITYAGEPDMIFHCAGSGSVGFSISHPYQDYQRTVETTHAVLEYIRTVSPHTILVLPSSAGVYGLVESLPIKVNAFLNPVSPYGLHKKVAEDLCRCYGKHFGVRSALIRLFSIYGIGLRKQLLWDACTKITAGVSSFGGTGHETRDWLHVEDAASLMIEAAQHADGSCPIANGGTGVATPNSKIIAAIADELGAKLTPEYSGLIRAGDPIHYQADISEAQSWGWTAKHDWYNEVRAYVRWFNEGAP